MTSLERLLRPQSIAVIGGGTWCANVISECRKIGFTGEIWPVHPHRDALAGLPTYKSLTELPKAPDAAFVGVNREASISVVRELSAQGCGGAVCFAAGFREAEAEVSGGAALQDALTIAAGEMPILGPNCYGFINALDHVALWPDQHGMGGVPLISNGAEPCGAAIISQSSNIAINLTMQQRGLPLAYLVTVGNQAQTDLADVGRALLGDPRVTALGLYLEGIGDLARFEALAAYARKLGKPIITLKVGSSEEAKAATISHTASLAGSEVGAKALLARLGIGQVSSLAALIETLKLLHITGPLSSHQIASMSCSGGEASLVADAAQAQDLKFPPLNARQSTELRQVLGPKVALANPLDYQTYIWGDLAAMTGCFSAMMDPAHALGCVILDFPRPDRCKIEAWTPVIDAAEATQKACAIPMAILASLPETMPESIAEELMARSIVPLCGMSEGLEAISVAASLGEPRSEPLPLWPTGEIQPTVKLTEFEAKQSLAKHGLDVPKSYHAKSPDQAGELAETIGFPVVLKGEGAAHKTEAGLVKLDLRSAESTVSAAKSMAATSFLVEEQITEGTAELIVGILRDPAHGFILRLGAGGVLAEILHDHTALLLPVTAADIDKALDRLKIAPMLRGYRGGAPASREAIVRAVLALQSYAKSERESLIELEVNPLLCTPGRAAAVDALIQKGEPQ